MGASDPIGGQKFWFNGLPYQGVAKPGTDTLGIKYWFNGVPASTVIPAATGALPFSQVGSAASPRLNLTVTPAQPYNLALYTVTAPAALPFNQADWSGPRRLIGAAQVAVGLNPNLFTNPIPFNQFDWSKPQQIPLTQPRPQDGLNLNLFTNPVPFNQTDWSNPFRVPLALPQPQIGLNPNLFKNPVPFNQTDWEKRVRVPHITPDASVSLNPNLQKNPIPNNQTDWEKPRRVRSEPPAPSVSLNPNLQKNPLPNNQTDWSQSRRVTDFLPDGSRSLNPNLVPAAVEALPFNQTDWSQQRRVPAFLPDGSVSLNPNLFTNPIPFKGSLGSLSPLDLRGAPDVSQPYNAALYTATVVSVPFNQTDWATSRRIVGETQVPDGLNPNLFTNTVPFNQVDWSKPQQIRITQPFPQVGLNINLFTNPVPVANLGPVLAVQRCLPDDVSQPYNPNLYAVVVVAAPFNQSDFAVAARPALSVAPPSAFNPNLQTNPLPFSQFDYPPARRVPAAPIDLSRGQPNPNIFTNPMPFLQSDIGTPRASRSTAPPDAINVALWRTPIATTPLPFNQYDWTPAAKPQPQRLQDLLNATLIASFVPPPPDADQHSKPFFATPGKLMGM